RGVHRGVRHCTVHGRIRSGRQPQVHLLHRRRVRILDRVEPVAHRFQGVALERIPAHAASARVPPRRRQSHSTGPDSAYSVAAMSRVLGGSTHSAINTPTAISSATNGTRSAFGPLPLPLKLL